MSIHLQALTASEYSTWFDASTLNYAKDKVRAKQWSQEGSLEQAQKDTQRLLPQGIDTENHHICHIINSSSDECVGSLWWCVTERFGRRVLFIFDLHIHEAYRRKGFATAALKHLEAQARSEGIEALSLHVFAFNKGAYELYNKLGYATTSFNMTCELNDFTSPASPHQPIREN